MEYVNADMILYDGNVITVDKNNTLAEAVAVNDGKIMKDGSNREIEDLKGKHTEMIDLGKKTLLPGFIDAHTHVDLLGMAASDVVVDCHMPPVNNVDEILKKIKEKVDKTTKGELVLAQGRFVQPYPTKEQLDAVSPNHPVIIRNSMHAYRLNSFSLKKFHITRDKPTFEERSSDRL